MNLLRQMSQPLRNPCARLNAILLRSRLASLITLLCLIATPALAVTYSDNGDGTVTDPTTGLTWMRCSMGQTWDGTTCTGTASTYTWDQANALTGTVSFAGYSDWRLPNIRELASIVDWSRDAPAINTNAFPNTPTSLFWTASTYASGSNFHWDVDFGYGYTDYNGHGLQVRLVRGAQSLALLDMARPTSDYVDNGDGTVTHTPTGLMWKRCAEGQNWDGSTCTGTAGNFTWDAAKLLTGTFAGNSDWRLPTEDELLTLVDYTRSGSAINTTWFPATALDSFFWSTSTYALLPAADAWGVAFGYGGFGYAGNTCKGCASFQVRLVRTGQSFNTFALTVATTGDGTVVSTLTDIYCGSTCTANYTSGTKVILTATPAAGSSFSRWSGACSGTAATCTVTMSAAQSVTASFSDTQAPSVPRNLAVAAVSISQVNVSWSPSTDNIGVSSYKLYRDGTQIATVSAPTASYSDTGLTASTSGRSYAVQACDAAANCSAQSPSALTITLAGVVGNSALTYSDNGDGTVTDMTTGLTWMRCSIGQTWDGTTCTGMASAYTSWDQVNALTGTVSFAGNSDWRLPNIRELLTIVNHSASLPIDTVAFPETPSGTDSWYWSASAYTTNSTTEAWAVWFANGYTAPFVKYGKPAYVRFVRGGQPLGLLDVARPTSDYVDNGDGTITHTPTGLMWKRCAEGQAWNGSTCSGTAGNFTWDATLTSTYAGKNDWRMPTEEELLTLVDYTKYSPAINTTVFPNAGCCYYYWSTSTYTYVAGNSSEAWDVLYSNGSANYYPKNGSYPVRLVRAGQSFDAFALTVSKTGTGTVSGSALTGITCGNTCSAIYNYYHSCPKQEMTLGHPEV